MPSEVDNGVVHHKAGRIQEAIQCYNNALSINPKNPDALHLLGVIAHQSGDHHTGIEKMRAATEIKPGEATYHSNLADAYRTVGDIESCEKHARKAIALNSNTGEAYNILGVVLMQKRSEPEEIEALFRKAIEINPKSTGAYNNLANFLRQTKGIEAALSAFEDAVKASPGFAPALCNYGQALLDCGRVDEALCQCQIAAALGPELPEAHNNLANVFRVRGNPDVALALYDRSLSINPDLAITHCNVGQTLQSIGRLEPAEQAFLHASKLAPKEARYHGLLGGLYADRMRYDDAIAAFKRAIDCAPNLSDPKVGYANALMELQRYDEALELLEEAQQLPGDRVGCLLTTSRWYYEKGKIEECVHFAREVLKLHPKNPAALHYVAATKRAETTDEEVAVLKEQANNLSIHEVGRMTANYTLASVLDAKKEAEEAATTMRTANAIQQHVREHKNEHYHRDHHKKFIDNQIEHFTAEKIKEKAQHGVNSKTPIFIIGVPRSGTTLIEQVVSGHPSIFGAGELANVAQLADSLPRRMQMKQIPAACYTQLNPTQINAFAEETLNKMRDLAEGEPYITDKMPDNYMHAGLIMSLFPNAKIINCRRNLRDVALSAYITQFKAIRWANNPEDIAGRIDGYIRLMKHWEAQMPGKIHDVFYEDSVGDLETAAKGIFNFLDIEYDPTCLDFQNNKRAVKTASVMQVRQPIYKRSVARWKRYEDHLSDLFEHIPESY